MTCEAIVAGRLSADNRNATKGGFGRTNGGCICRHRCTSGAGIDALPSSRRLHDVKEVAGRQGVFEAVCEDSNEYSFLGVTLVTAIISCLRISADVRVCLRPFADSAGAMSLEMTCDMIHSEGVFRELVPAALPPPV